MSRSRGAWVGGPAWSRAGYRDWPGRNLVFWGKTLCLHLLFEFFFPLFFFWKLQASILNAAEVKFREKISRFGM